MPVLHCRGYITFSLKTLTCVFASFLYKKQNLQYSNTSFLKFYECFIWARFVSFCDMLLCGCAWFSGGKAETQSDLSQACGTTQDDKVNAFRPLMKRWSRWEPAPSWIGGNQYQIDTTLTTFTKFLLINAIHYFGAGFQSVHISLMKWKPGVLFSCFLLLYTLAKGKNGIFIMH